MKRQSSLFLLGLLCMGAIANADSLKFTGTELSNAQSVSITVNGTGPVSVKAGRLMFTDGANTFSTYCADALRFLNYSFNNYNSFTLDTNASDGLSRAGRILGANFASANTASKQAGLQLAIWSAIYDNGANFDASGTNFQVSNASSSALNHAAVYYQSVNQPLPSNTAVRFYEGIGNHAQSQMTVECVPEPASMAALGLGAAALIRRRRKSA